MRSSTPASHTTVSQCALRALAKQTYVVLLHGPLLTVLGRRTTFEAPLTSRKMLSSLHITLFHCSGVQSRYFLANCSHFSFMVSVRSGFLVARRQGRPRSFCSRCCKVRTATIWSSSGCFFFNSAAVMEGFCFTSLTNTLSVLAVVFLLRPPLSLRGGVVPAGSAAADFLSLKRDTRLTFSSTATRFTCIPCSIRVRARVFSSVVSFFRPIVMLWWCLVWCQNKLRGRKVGPLGAAQRKCALLEL